MSTPQRPDPTPAELRQDVWLALAFLAGALVSTMLGSVWGMWGERTAGLEWATPYAIAISVPLAFRRRYPVTVAIVLCAVFFAASNMHVPESIVGNISVFVAVYTVGAWVNDRRRAFLARVLLSLAMLVWLLVVIFLEATGESPEGGLSRAGMLSPFLAYALMNILINVFYFGSAYYLGDRAYGSALRRVALAERTAELEAARELAAAQAVALDRVRIARELHDVVAHHVSAMGVQAAAARAMLERDPESSRRALDGVAGSAREAITELHLLLDTLRTPDASVTDASTIRLDDLRALVAHTSELGTPATFEAIGEPVLLPDTVQVNLYRIAQEALTNARRHGGPEARADVRLRYLDGAVELEVANTGRSAPRARSGLGHLGMRERAAASGGSIEIGPRPRGGYLVRVRIPVDAYAEAAR